MGEGRFSFVVSVRLIVEFIGGGWFREGIFFGFMVGFLEVAVLYFISGRSR